nr:probable mediator of RNA polymerase II transcription subunit 26b [Tanacetum cinerariifolium]
MAISQCSALCMDQWRELFSNAGVDIFQIIQRSIKIAASDRPNEFKNMRGNIAELLFACNYVHNSDDNNLATVEHKATGHRFNINEDATRGDKESKDSLDGGIDVKGKMIDLFTFFDGIDDDGEVHNKKMEETPNKKRQGKQLKPIMEAEIEKQSTGLKPIKLKPIKHSGYVEKRLHIPATSCAPNQLLRVRPGTLGESFYLARIIEARLKAITEKEKEQIIKKKADAILSLRSELASPDIKRSLDGDEDIGVDEVSSVIHDVFDSGKSLIIFLKWVQISRPRPLLLMVSLENTDVAIGEEVKIQRRIWDPGIKIVFRQHFEDKVVSERVRSVTIAKS